MNKPQLLIYGGGGHCKALIDIIRSVDRYQIAGILDDGLSAGTDLMGVPVLGKGDMAKELFQKGIRLAVNAVGGIGDYAQRLHVFEHLQALGFEFPTVIHPTAYVEPSATLAPGCQLLAFVYVGSDCRVGFGTLLNAHAILSHDVVLGQVVNLSPGAMLAGSVEVGDYSQVGMGVTINLHNKVGKRCRIGNGATVKGDVPDGTVVHAGAIYPDPHLS
ncbi:MAG TPA: NeuD/PglB/VioB family sugar acetyltransferase [Longilinea sp.]|nr:NeuD/PglB/VioB family sugar acetyltransferase [Longilinea sp.]